MRSGIKLFLYFRYAQIFSFSKCRLYAQHEVWEYSYIISQRIYHILIMVPTWKMKCRNLFFVVKKSVILIFSVLLEHSVSIFCCSGNNVHWQQVSIERNNRTSKSLLMWQPDTICIFFFKLLRKPKK